MIDINWEEFKEYKGHILSKKDNFNILLDFIRSYYNISNPSDIFEILIEDMTAQLMLEKRGISDAEGLENFMYHNQNG